MTPDFSESSLRIRAAIAGTLRKRVLVSSDNHGLRHLIASTLKRNDLEVVESGLDKESRDRVMLMPGSRALRRIDLAILDARSDPETALSILSTLIASGDTLALVICGSDEVAVAAAERGAAVIRPPVTASALRAALAPA